MKDTPAQTMTPSVRAAVIREARQRTRESLQVTLASLDEHERDALADALATWITERTFCATPGERAINGMVTDALERRGIDIWEGPIGPTVERGDPAEEEA